LEIQLPAYDVQQFIARGGMGAVYRGMQTSLGRQVAIKILPPELREADPHYAARFKQEARAMAQLNHPSIVSVYDFGEMPDGTFYFIMEFIDGTDVGQMVAQQGRLASAHAMAITAHVCDALQYAHERGIVHRDIKPANIMVGFDGRVKVADFGLAKSIRQVDTGLTQSGFVMGTPHFVAPEAMIMGVSVDHRADIYAVGVMLYQMLTGKVPQGLFEMPSLQVPGLDPRYDAIVSSAMREDREQRYQRILDMRHALDAILTQPVQRSEIAKQTNSLVTAPESTPALKPQPGQQYYRPPQSAKPVHIVPKKTSTGMWVALAAIAVVLGGAGFIIWGGKTKESSVPKTLAEISMQPSLASTPIAPSSAVAFPSSPPSESPSPKTTVQSLPPPPAPLYRFTFDGETPEKGVELTNVLQHDGIIELNGLHHDFDMALCTPEMNPRKFTIAVRIFPDNFDRHPARSVGNPNNDGVLLAAKFDLHLSVTRDRKMFFGIEGIGSGLSDTIPNLEPGRWMTAVVACDLDKKLARAYLDGKPLVDLKVDPAAQVKYDKGADSRSWSFIYSRSGDAIKGAVDEVVVYGAALSDYQIAALSLGGANRNPPRKPVPDTDTIFKASRLITTKLERTVPLGGSASTQLMSGKFTDFSWNPVQITLRGRAGSGSFNLPTAEVTMTGDVAPEFSDQKWNPGFDGLKQVRGQLSDIFAFDLGLWELRDVPSDGSSVSMRESKGLVTRPAPSFNVTTTLKRAVRVPDDYQGKLLLLHLWPDDPSQQHVEFDSLLTFYAKYHSAGLEILSIYSGASAELKTPQARGFPWPMAFVLENDELYNQYRTHQHSMLFFINGNTGKIMHMGLHCGHLKAVDERIRTLLDWVKRPQSEVIPTANEPLNPSPSASVPSPITLSQTVDVKLEFINAEKYYDVGGYQPSEVPLSTKVPRSVSNAPTGLISPLYGELKLGPPSSQRSHAIILSNPKTENARLFVDGNANGDLTDDPPAQWKPGQKSNLVTGEKWDAFEGDFSVELSFADGTHRARFEVFADNSNGSTSDSLLIHPQYGRVGSVNLNGKNYKALLYDDGSKGDFSAPSSTFRLDLAGGSGFRWEEAEAFPVTEFFTLEGMTFQLAGLTPSGDAFKIVPTPSWIGQTAPTLSATTITGSKISLPGDYKGKIVLMHFWSIGQKLGLDDLPQLKAAYEKHPSASFDMLGICVEYRRGKDMLPAFVKDNNILWPQVCEHQSGARDHPVLKLFKTHSVPSSFLLDGDTGGILACGLRGSALEEAIAKALAEKKRTPSQVNPTKKSPLNPAPSASDAEFHRFTNTKGQSIRAALVKISGDDIVLRKEDGIEYTVKAATLSAFDIVWLKTKGLVMTETEMPKPVAATPAPPASVPATPSARVLVVPEESKTSTLQHTMIFGLPRTDAATIISNPLLKSNPKAVLETVQGMATEKRATLVSNLSVSSKFGNRSRVEAAYGCESEVTMKADGSLNAMFAITSLRSPASPRLVVSDIAAKRGDVCFLGSFDESEPDPKMPVRLVFVTFH
jgi:serine/threonine protein kinase